MDKQDDNPSKYLDAAPQYAVTGRYTRPSSTNDPDKILHEMIELHRREIENVAEQLAKEAKRKTILSSSVKATVIFLGALVAIKEIANQLVGSSNVVNIIVFTVAGLLIATLTGLEAAFKWGDTSAELKVLAAESRAESRKAASSLAKIFATKDGKERLKGLEQILDTLDKTIIDIQKRAAKIGIEMISATNIYGEQKVEISDYTHIRGIWRHGPRTPIPPLLKESLEDKPPDGP